jgi:hypothetical protein
MSVLYRMLDEHRSLLENRGYTVEGLSNPEQKDHLFKAFERAASRACRESLNDQEPITFEVGTYGFFDHDERLISFELHYQLDAEQMDLRLLSIDISEDALKRTIVLDTSYHLPAAKEAPALMDKYKAQLAGRQDKKKTGNDIKPNQKKRK